MSKEVYKGLPQFEDYYSFQAFCASEGWTGLLFDIETMVKNDLKRPKLRVTQDQTQGRILEWWNGNSDRYGDRDLNYYVADGLVSYRPAFIMIIAMKDCWYRTNREEKTK